MAVDYEKLRKKAKKRDEEKQKKDAYEYSRSMYEGAKKKTAAMYLQIRISFIMMIILKTLKPIKTSKRKELMTREKKKSQALQVLLKYD